jgi:hypothetical protein
MYGMNVNNTVLKMKSCLFLYSELPEMLMKYSRNYQYANHGDDMNSRSIVVIFIRMGLSGKLDQCQIKK